VVYCLRRYYMGVAVGWSIWWSPLYLCTEVSCHPSSGWMYLLRASVLSVVLIWLQLVQIIHALYDFTKYSINIMGTEEC
jgi:hypothetical protein